MGAAGAASLRYKNYFEVTLVCEKSPIRYGFLAALSDVVNVSLAGV